MDWNTTMTTDNSQYDNERSLISCMRDDDDESYKIYAHAIDEGITADHFQNEAINLYWQALVRSEKENDFGYFGAMQRLNKDFDGRYPYFNSEVILCHDVPTFTKAEIAIKGLVRNYTFRQLRNISKNLELEVSDAEILTDPISIAHHAEKQIQELIIPKSSTLSDADKLSEGTILMIEDSINQGPARIVPHIPWLRYGLEGGFKNTHMIVVAARPGVGKTTLVLNFAYHAALKGKKTLFFSLEMKGEYLWEKLALIRAGRGLPYKTKDRAKNIENAKILKEYVNQCRSLPIYIDDNGSAKISDIRSTAKVMHRKIGLDCVVIDYCTLVKPEDSRIPREQQVADISRSAKALAKELDLPVFLIAQLNRDSVKKGVEPQLHDLRDSGQIEQDADVVILMHRDYLKDKEDVKIITAKNRFGGCGHSRDKIKFKPEAQTFVQVEDNRLNNGTRELSDEQALWESTGGRTEEPRI